MDPCDQASEREEIELARAIEAARGRATEPTGKISDECANDCGELRAAPSRYCSPECRDAVEYRARILRKQGMR